MKQNLSSAAVLIGALRVNRMVGVDAGQNNHTLDLILYIPLNNLSVMLRPVFLG